jgi:hypothetical protein
VLAGVLALVFLPLPFATQQARYGVRPAAAGHLDGRVGSGAEPHTSGPDR